jgi:hypothetical protein
VTLTRALDYIAYTGASWLFILRIQFFSNLCTRQRYSHAILLPTQCIIKFLYCWRFFQWINALLWCS